MLAIRFSGERSAHHRSKGCARRKDRDTEEGCPAGPRREVSGCLDVDSHARVEDDRQAGHEGVGQRHSQPERANPSVNLTRGGHSLSGFKAARASIASARANTGRIRHHRDEEGVGPVIHHVLTLPTRRPGSVPSAVMLPGHELPATGQVPWSGVRANLGSRPPGSPSRSAMSFLRWTTSRAQWLLLVNDSSTQPPGAPTTQEHPLDSRQRRGRAVEQR